MLTRHPGRQSDPADDGGVSGHPASPSQRQQAATATRGARCTTSSNSSGSSQSPLRVKCRSDSSSKHQSAMLSAAQQQGSSSRAAAPDWARQVQPAWHQAPQHLAGSLSSLKRSCDPSKGCGLAESPVASRQQQQHHPAPGSRTSELSS